MEADPAIIVENQITAKICKHLTTAKYKVVMLLEAFKGTHSILSCSKLMVMMYVCISCHKH